MEKERDRNSKLYILFIMIVIIVVITFQLVRSFHQYNAKQEEIEMLKYKIEKENEKKAKWKEHEKYMQSDAYIEEKAREKFNLIKDGEEIYIPKKE